MSAEATVVRNYIEWMVGLPWGSFTEDKKDVTEAERILEEDHYGLKNVKERILEHIAVGSLVEEMKGPILCLVGPPGVGKTSLAKSVARATGRNFVRISLGGVKDEAEIRGHRRDIHRLHAREDYPVHEEGRKRQPARAFGRGGQDEPRLPRRPGVRPFWRCSTRSRTTRLTTTTWTAITTFRR